jgi:hypothetical protein
MNMKQNNKYSLRDTENFNKELTVAPNTVMAKYTELLVEYTKFIRENIKIKNQNYSKFIVIRGLDTITHVFTTILYYTKNIDIAYFHCQKSLYFYVEFISQISEAEKLFLQLSSRDAATYVYKKTLFDLNNTKTECSNESKLKFDTIGELIKIQKTILLNVLHGSRREAPSRRDPHPKVDLKKVEPNQWWGAYGGPLEKVGSIEDFEELAGKLNSLTLDLDKIIQLTRIIDVLYYKTDTLFLNQVTKLINKLLNHPDSLDTEEQKINQGIIDSSI